MDGAVVGLDVQLLDDELPGPIRVGVPRQGHVAQRLAARIHVHPHPPTAVRPLPHQLHVVAHLGELLAGPQDGVRRRVGRDAGIGEGIRLRNVDRIDMAEAAAVLGQLVDAGRAQRDLRLVRRRVVNRRRERRVGAGRHDAVGKALRHDRMALPVRMQFVREEVACRRQRHGVEEIHQTQIGGQVARVHAGLQERVERRHLGLHAVCVVLPVENCGGHDLDAGPLPDDFPHEVRPVHVCLLRRLAVASHVVRPDEQRDDVRLADYVQVEVQVVQHAAALVRGDDGVAAHARVPRPFIGSVNARLVLIRVLPDSAQRGPVAMRGKMRRHGRAVLRIVALVVLRHALRDGVADRRDADRLGVLLVAAHTQNKLVGGAVGRRLDRQAVGRSTHARRVERGRRDSARTAPCHQHELAARHVGIRIRKHDLRAGCERRRGLERNRIAYRVEDDFLVYAKSTRGTRERAPAYVKHLEIEWIAYAILRRSPIPQD